MEVSKEVLETIPVIPAPPCPPKLKKKGRACTCCGVVAGPGSWELKQCFVCYESTHGKQISPWVIMFDGGKKTVRFKANHTKCPLKDRKETT